MASAMGLLLYRLAEISAKRFVRFSIRTEFLQIFIIQITLHSVQMVLHTVMGAARLLNQQLDSAFPIDRLRKKFTKFYRIIISEDLQRPEELA